MELAIIILAAGESKRLGTSKQLLKLNIHSLLRQAASSALKVTDNVVVVTGFDHRTMAGELEGLPCAIAINPDWKNGMGSSIKAGLRYAYQERKQLKAVLYMVCDQPLVSKELLDKLVLKFKQGNDPVASAYANTYGVPALFGYQYFDDILKLNDEDGAKKILHKNKPALVPFPAGSFDIDTPEQLQSFKKKYFK